jgi:altronate hydrolase
VGARILKYGQTIGYAMSDIPSGTHLHTHNVEFRATDAAYQFGTNLRDVSTCSRARSRYIYGIQARKWQRGNAQLYCHCHIRELFRHGCTAHCGQFWGRGAIPISNVDGVVAFVHGTGCGMAGDGEGFEALQRVMWGYAKHPNHGGVVMVGLGCEMNQIDWLLDAYGLKAISDLSNHEYSIRCGFAEND